MFERLTTLNIIIIPIIDSSIYFVSPTYNSCIIFFVNTTSVYRVKEYFSKKVDKCYYIE